MVVPMFRARARGAVRYRFNPNDPERRVPTKWRRLAISCIAAAIILVACGSGDGGPATQEAALPTPTANRLATLSDRVASQLDSGETCHAAHTAAPAHTATSTVTDLGTGKRSVVQRCVSAGDAGDHPRGIGLPHDDPHQPRGSHAASTNTDPGRSLDNRRSPRRIQSGDLG